MAAALRKDLNSVSGVKIHLRTMVEDKDRYIYHLKFAHHMTREKLVGQSVMADWLNGRAVRHTQIVNIYVH